MKRQSFVVDLRRRSPLLEGQPYRHRKGSCVAVDKASVFAMHQRLILDCCVSALGSEFLLSHFVPVVRPAPRASGLTGRRVGDGPPAAQLAWGTSSGSVGGVGHLKCHGRSIVRVLIDRGRSDGRKQPGVSNRHTQENRYECISFGWLIQHCFPSVC